MSKYNLWDTRPLQQRSQYLLTNAMLGTTPQRCYRIKVDIISEKSTIEQKSMENHQRRKDLISAGATAEIMNNIPLLVLIRKQMQIKRNPNVF
jgi:hypothetical protein